jgi:hypothetical protein
MNLKKLFLACLIMVAVTSCTQTMTMVHTSGTASDVVDETSSAEPNVSPTINVPVTPGAGLGLGK